MGSRSDSGGCRPSRDLTSAMSDERQRDRDQHDAESDRRPCDSLRPSRAEPAAEPTHSLWPTIMGEQILHPPRLFLGERLALGLTQRRMTT